MFEPDPLAAGEFEDAAAGTRASTGATNAASAGRSAALRNCFRVSADPATGVPVFGATGSDGSADPVGRLPNIVWINESAISTSDAVPCGATGCVPVGTARSMLEDRVDPDWINDS